MPDLDPAHFSAFLQAFGLTFVSISATDVVARLDAGPDHHTPWGVVHGGVYATAIESATSVGASTAVQDHGQFAVGLSNATDFVRSHTDGPLEVTAHAIHQGQTGQLWSCDITRADGKLIARGTVRLQNVPMTPGS